jgi:hypothetical protein
MVEHVLRASIERNWVITIMYQKGLEITKRNIKVMEIHEDSITAFCYLRKETRRFKLYNILSAAFFHGRVALGKGVKMTV